MVAYRGVVVSMTGFPSRSRRPGRHDLEQNLEAQGNGEYFVQFGFGTPPKQIYTVLDTGNDLTWIQCQPCVDCYKQNDPIFDPAMSKSYTPLPCKSNQCKQLHAPSCNRTRKTCLYEIPYVDNSITAGDFVTETLTISDTPYANIPIGCGHKNTGSFGKPFGKTSGIFGLGRGSLSFVSQAQYSAFSYCLAHANSSEQSLLRFGSSATFIDDIFTAKMLRDSKVPSLYFVGLTGISVNEQVFPIPSLDPSTGYGGSIIDCGTTVTRFPREVYNNVREGFVKAATGLTFVGRFGPFDACFPLASLRETDFPTVAFHFGENLLTLSRENVMFSVSNYTCFGFAPAEGSYSLIGSHQQQGIRVSFDQDRSTIGFLPDSC